MQLPKSIENCPIVESVVEIRFSSNTHKSAIFGILYNAIKDDFPTVENLPILQFPENLREIDPNLKFKPHYRVSNSEYYVQIGPDVLSISPKLSYPGWTNYSKNINHLFSKIFELSIISTVHRLGLRYINFFENVDILSNITLKLESSLSFNKAAIKIEISEDSFTNDVSIINHANHRTHLSNSSGSIIDIDSYKNYIGSDFIQIYSTEIESIHTTEKTVFFTLLKSDFTSSLNARY